MRLTKQVFNLYDPNFMVRLKKLQSRYREAYQTNHKNAVSNEAFMDFTDRGAAWFIGNMAKTKIELERKMRHVDFVVEVRDARLPFTTANPDIDSLTKDKPRLIIFNKADLANKQCNDVLAQYYENMGTYVVFTNAEVAWKMTLNSVIRFVMKCVPVTSFKTAPHLGLLVGMPNVGKSSILNALRVAHEFQFQKNGVGKHREGQVVSCRPGSTRHISTVPVSLDPPISIMDTPGLTLPGNFNYKAGQKLALLGIIPTNNSSLQAKNLAEHVYNLLTQSGMVHHLADCMRISRVPVNFDDFLKLMAKRCGTSAHNQIGAVNRDVLYSIVVNDFQAGRLGRITLDTIPRINTVLNLGEDGTHDVNNEHSKRQTEQDVKTSDCSQTNEYEDKLWDKEMKNTLSRVESCSDTISRQKGPISQYRLSYKIRGTI